MLAVRLAAAGRETTLAELDLPLDLPELLGGAECVRDWEVEIGFGKGRYLLEQARTHPDCGFLGIEVASKYYRHVRDRSRREGLGNLIVVRGEALYLLAAVVPAGFARSVHVYFPDPWPKSRHQERRLLDPESLDLLLGLLKPDGVFHFATDYREYGERVARLLRDHPAVRVESADRLERPRTHYEDKYQREGRAIRRVKARLVPSEQLFHPLVGRGVLAAVARAAELPDGSDE